MSENKYDTEQMLDDLARAFVDRAVAMSDHPSYDELSALQKYNLKLPLMTALNIYIPVMEKHMAKALKIEVSQQLRDSIAGAESMGLRAEDAISMFTEVCSHG